MSWQVRHEGSPNVTSNLTAQQVLEGMAEGVWEHTDEVRGPNEMKWQKLEEHPFFAEAVADLEQPEKYHDVETHLDMNPLIDVALVLLIFFILTTTYDALRKAMDMPTMSASGQQAIKVIDNDKLKSEYVRVKARTQRWHYENDLPGSKYKNDSAKQSDEPVYEVDDEDLPDSQLKFAIMRGRGSNPPRTKLLIDAEGVTWDSVCKIIDAGKGAQVTKMQIKVQKE